MAEAVQDIPRLDPSSVDPWERHDWLPGGDELPDWLTALKAKHTAAVGTFEGDFAALVDLQAEQENSAREWRRSVRQAVGVGKAYSDRREHALVLKRDDDGVEVPDGEAWARLQRVVADAKEDAVTIARVKLEREDEKRRIIAANLAYFDGEAEGAARALEAEAERLLAALDSFMQCQERKNRAWRRGQDGRRTLEREKMPAVGFNDLGDLRGKVADATRKAWPGESEQRWREFNGAEGLPPVKVTNREAIMEFSGGGAA
jgi:hypothetical protein